MAHNTSQPKKRQTLSLDHRLHGETAFLLARTVSTVLQKETKKLRSHWGPPPAHRVFLLVKTPMPIEKQTRIWQLLPLLSRNRRGHGNVEKRQPNTSGTKQIVARKTAHVLGNSTRTTPSAKCQIWKTSLRATGWNKCQNPRTAKGTKDVVTLTSLVESLVLYSDHHFRKTERGPFCAYRGAGFPPTLLLAADPRVRPCERALPYRLCKVRTKPSTNKGLVPGDFDHFRGRQAVQLTLVNSWTKPEQEVGTLQTYLSVTTTRFTLWSTLRKSTRSGQCFYRIQ